MNQKFIASNRQAKKVIIGMWEDVCDLDKRLWNVRKWESEDVANDFQPKPLCYIDIIPKYHSGDDIVDSIFRPIYSHQDLVGVYLG